MAFSRKIAWELVAFAVAQAAMFAFAWLVVLMLRDLGFSVQPQIAAGATNIDWRGVVIRTAFDSPLSFVALAALFQLIIAAVFVVARVRELRPWAIASGMSTLYVFTLLFCLAAGLHLVVASRLPGGAVVVP